MEIQKMSKILIIGATGHLGKYLVEASAKLASPTIALVRKVTLHSNPEKAKLIKFFKSSGVTVLYGDLHEHESLLKSINQVDVVFSAMSQNPIQQIADQINIIAAIKQEGTIKRCTSSEFGADVDRVCMLEPGIKVLIKIKSKIRQALREARTPFTFVSSNFFPTYFLSRLLVEATGLPEDKIHHLR